MKIKKDDEKKPRAAKDSGTVPAETSDSPGRTEQPDLSHLSSDWQEFYRLVIAEIV